MATFFDFYPIGTEEKIVRRQRNRFEGHVKYNQRIVVHGLRRDDV